MTAWSSTADIGATAVKLLVYGLPGVGKTRLAATTGEPERTLVIDCEAGLLSLRGHQIPAVSVRSLAELGQVYEQLAQDGSDFRWIVVDSLSELAELHLDALKQKHRDPRQAYGELSESMLRAVRKVRDLPMNVAFTAKAAAAVDDRTGAMSYGPSMPGRQLAQALPYLFDEVFALRVERDADGKPTRWLQTQPDGCYAAKDRSGALDVLEPPDLCGIHTKIMRENAR